jgi:hypothetical protein
MKEAVFMKQFGLLLFVLVLLGSVTACKSQPKAPTGDARARFDILQKLEWREIFADSCTGDWRQKWFLDGGRAKAENSREGMTIFAGPKDQSDADHAVLWTKEIFEADNLKIEFNFTRIDRSPANSVNIIYILAQGGGGKSPDIQEWAQERTEPAMSKYFNNMDTYHISYAVSGTAPAPESEKYIRGRRYMPSKGGGLAGTELFPEYMDVPLFEPGTPYRMTFIKAGRELFLNVRGNGKDMVFYFDASGFPPIVKGRVGLRQMFTRVSLYSDIKISAARR